MSVEVMRAVKERYEPYLLSLPGVVGVGLSATGVIVYVESTEVTLRVPTILDGVPILTVVTGRVRRI